MSIPRPWPSETKPDGDWETRVDVARALELEEPMAPATDWTSARRVLLTTASDYVPSETPYVPSETPPAPEPVPGFAPRRHEQILTPVDPGLVLGRARDTLANIAAVERRANDLRDRLARARETADVREAELAFSPAFGELKNETARRAWLVLQRRDDMVWAQALSVVRHLAGELASAEARASALEREYDLAQAELKLHVAQLRFLAAGSVEEA